MTELLQEMIERKKTLKRINILYFQLVNNLMVLILNM